MKRHITRFFLMVWALGFLSCKFNSDKTDRALDAANIESHGCGATNTITNNYYTVPDPDKSTPSESSPKEVKSMPASHGGSLANKPIARINGSTTQAMQLLVLDPKDPAAEPNQRYFQNGRKTLIYFHGRQTPDGRWIGTNEYRSDFAEVNEAHSTPLENLDYNLIMPDTALFMQLSNVGDVEVNIWKQATKFYNPSNNSVSHSQEALGRKSLCDKTYELIRAFWVDDRGGSPLTGEVTIAGGDYGAQTAACVAYKLKSSNTKIDLKHLVLIDPRYHAAPLGPLFRKADGKKLTNASVRNLQTLGPKVTVFAYRDIHFAAPAQTHLSTNRWKTYRDFFKNIDDLDRIKTVR